MESVTENTSWVGRPIPKVDGPDKVTGRALYVADLQREGEWVGRTVRSDQPHGVLRRVYRDPNFDWTDVVFVTAEDIPGRNCILLMDEDQPALVPTGGIVRHMDEPVALVAAPTLARARAAAAAVRMDIEPRPYVSNLDDALKAKVDLGGDGNVFKRLRVDKGGDVDAVLAECAHVVVGTYRTGAQEQMYIEPQGMLAWWEGPRLHVRGSLQCPYYVHAALRPLLDVGDDDLDIGAAVTGGGFGGKEEYPSMVAAHAALLSRAARRPIKLLYDREEDLRATTKRHPAVVHHRLGLDKEGRIQAIDAEITLDGGAYVTLTPVVLSRAVLHASGPYRCPNVRITGRAVFTNTPPHGAFRGFGAPQVTFAYERQMDEAARRLGLEPFELRRRNMLRLGDETATGQRLAYSVGSEDVLQRAQEQLRRSPPRRPSALGPTEVRGRGLAFYFHGAGFTGRGEERLQGKVEVAALADGRFEVRAASTDLGQGAFTTFTQLAADALGVDPGRVTVATPRTSKVPDSGPTVASRTLMVVGSVVAQASRALRTSLLTRWRKEVSASAVEKLDLSAVAREVVARDGEVRELGTYRSPEGIHFDESTYRGDAYPVFGWAACVAEVVVDRETLEVRIDRLIHAVDVGKAIHPVIVRGQIEGGTVQALGWALWEQVVYQKGRVANPRMATCVIPTAVEVPPLETVIVEVPYPHGPHGAKGVGELPMDGPAAAVANGLADALGDEWGPPNQLPLVPEVLLELAPQVTGGER